jgi:hypothetical protein
MEKVTLSSREGLPAAQCLLMEGGVREAISSLPCPEKQPRETKPPFSRGCKQVPDGNQINTLNPKYG